MFGFERLDVWRKAIDFADLVYAATRSFPDDERFGLRNQMRRAVVSISSNIAEGSSRRSKKDFARFVELAYGSLMEVVSQLEIASNQKFIQAEPTQHIRECADELARMLSGLKSSLLKGS